MSRGEKREAYPQRLDGSRRLRASQVDIGVSASVIHCEECCVPRN